MEHPWSLSPEAVLASLQSSAAAGLSDSEVQTRQAQYGPNQLPTQTGRTPLKVLLAQFADWMVLLLAGAAMLSGLIGDWGDALLIALIVVANAGIGFAQEWRAEKAVAALRALAQPHAEVLRNGAVLSVPAAALVPGDILRLKAGDAVSADCRILQAVELEANESALTGESLAVEKRTEAVAADTGLPDRTCMLYSGTAVTRGHALSVVTGTGGATELGRIASLISTAEEPPTPLQQRLSRLSGQLAIVVVGVCCVMFVAGLIRRPFASWDRLFLSEMMLTAVSLAVAAIPEGLPAIVTVVLALGSQRMSRRNAIVRRLSAVETLGSVNVICSDKTGTLTQNRMTVVDVVPGVPVQDATRRAAEGGLLAAAALCNNAEMDSHGRAIGSATEAALLTAAQARLIPVVELQQRWRKLHELPFSSDRKRMSTLHRGPGGQSVVLVKGAIERILERSTAEGCLDPVSLSLQTTSVVCDHDQWTARAAELARQGRRVLGVAARHWPNGPTLHSDVDNAEQNLTLLGLIAIQDPVRPEATDAIARCQAAGIQTIMVTGDHIETGRAIARETGLLQDGGTAMTGTELERLSDSELRASLPNVAVFARVAPEHKLRIVRAFQSNGAVVAMTGDGVNDAPALKQAEIGVAMGLTGTDVARESSEMILADDNFATIVAAVEEGRVVFDNIRKFVAYLLTANTGEILVLFLAIVSGLPVPLLPVQILWINLVTDGLPALALGFEAAEKNVMQRKPRGRQSGVFDRDLAWMVVLIGSLMGLIALGLFLWIHDAAASDVTAARARTAVFTNLAIGQLFYVLAIRSRQQTLWQLGLWTNYRLSVAVVIGILLQLLLVYTPALNPFFRTVPLSVSELLTAAGLAVVPFGLLELWKLRPQRR